MHSAIYEGHVRHRRFSPKSHDFRYSLFMMYLDLNELPTLFEQNWLWSNDGWGLARFRRRDHLVDLAPATSDLADSVRDLVAERAEIRPEGPVRLLTHLEYFGYRFNPVSFYYCYDREDRRIQAVVAEINNTPWGEQHCYVLPCSENLTERQSLPFEFDKAFHISPFMGMEARYHWNFNVPGEQLAIHMENHESSGKVFDATMTLRRKAISPARLNFTLLRYPLMTGKVIAGIYWQALRLWLKRCPYYPHPKTYHPTRREA
jgi:DUF1365 family protein